MHRIGSPIETMGGSKVDAKSLNKFRKMLESEKDRLIQSTKNALKTDLVIPQEELADETDLAASELTQSLLFKLRDRERQLLGKIEVALSRIESGVFGVCEDCEEPIERKRLEARPVSTLCIACKEREERSERIYA